MLCKIINESKTTPHVLINASGGPVHIPPGKTIDEVDLSDATVSFWKDRLVLHNVMIEPLNVDPGHLPLPPNQERLVRRERA